MPIDSDKIKHELNEIFQFKEDGKSYRFFTVNATFFEVEFEPFTGFPYRGHLVRTACKLTIGREVISDRQILVAYNHNLGIMMFWPPDLEGDKLIGGTNFVEIIEIQAR